MVARVMFPIVGLAGVLSLAACGQTPAVSATRGAPSALCSDDGRGQVPPNDAQMVAWESSQKPKFTARGHASGPLVQVLPDHSGHKHFNVQIGGGGQVVEVIYQQEFGQLPDLQVGMQVDACGDFIKVVPGSTGTTGTAPGILHWVHAADGGGHPGGYVILDGVEYGQNG